MSPEEFRKLVNMCGALNESFDAQTDEEITSHTAGMDEDAVMDCLHILKAAGRAGIDPKEWTKQFREMQVDMPECGKFVADVARALLGVRVEKIGNLYRWIIEGTAEIPQEIRNGVETHVEASSAMMAYAERMDQFTVQGLARAAMSQAHLDSNSAMVAATVFLQHHHAMFDELGGGAWMMKQDEKRGGSISKDQYSQMFKDIANRASSANLGDE